MIPARSIPVTLGVLLGVAGLATEARAGANNAALDCKSRPSSKTSVRLSGDVPGDFAEFSRPRYSGPLTAAAVLKDVRLTCTLDHHI